MVLIPWCQYYGFKCETMGSTCNHERCTHDGCGVMGDGCGVTKNTHGVTRAEHYEQPPSLSYFEDFSVFSVGSCDWNWVMEINPGSMCGCLIAIHYLEWLLHFLTKCQPEQTADSVAQQLANLMHKHLGHPSKDVLSHAKNKTKGFPQTSGKYPFTCLLVYFSKK